MKRTKWIQKCEVDERLLPVPTQIVSNEEFAPPDQTDEQRKVAHRLNEIADSTSKKLGVSRRSFLASTGGMAAAFVAMNSVFGEFFDVSAAEMFEPVASDEKFPKKLFIFDIHTHHVAAPKIIRTPPLIPGYREAAAAWGNKSLEGREHKWEDPISRTQRSIFSRSRISWDHRSGKRCCLSSVEKWQERVDARGQRVGRRLGIYLPARLDRS